MNTKTCRHCGSVFPATNEFFVVDKRQSDGLIAVCKNCNNKRLREKYAKDSSRQELYRKTNRDKILARKRQHYQENRERLDKEHKQWRINNVEKHKSYCARKREQNRDKLNAQSRERYQRIKNHHSELTKRWKQEHKDLRNHHWQLRRARKQNVVYDLTFEQWESIKIHFDNKCAYCGKESKMTQDHFVPIVNGGGHTKSNIIPCCLSCNCSKSTKDFEKWYPTYMNYSKEREEKILAFIEAHKS